MDQDNQNRPTNATEVVTSGKTSGQYKQMSYFK